LLRPFLLLAKSASNHPNNPTAVPTMMMVHAIIASPLRSNLHAAAIHDTDTPPKKSFVPFFKVHPPPFGDKINHLYH